MSSFSQVSQSASLLSHQMPASLFGDLKDYVFDYLDELQSNNPGQWDEIISAILNWSQDVEQHETEKFLLPSSTPKQFDAISNLLFYFT